MATTFTEGVTNSLTPWIAQSPDFGIYVEALSAMFEPVWELVSDQGSPDEPADYQAGWSVLLDVDNCPTQYLPWLGQFIGVYVAPGTEDAAARAIIRTKAGWYRGTLPAVIAAIENAQATPDPTRYAIQERTGLSGADPYHFLISIDYASLATQGDPTQLIANVNAVRPVGVQFTVVPFSAPLVSQYTRLFSAITVPIAAAQLSDVT